MEKRFVDAPTVIFFNGHFNGWYGWGDCILACLLHTHVWHDFLLLFFCYTLRRLVAWGMCVDGLEKSRRLGINHNLRLLYNTCYHVAETRSSPGVCKYCSLRMWYSVCVLHRAQTAGWSTPDTERDPMTQINRGLCFARRTCGPQRLHVPWVWSYPSFCCSSVRYHSFTRWLPRRKLNVISKTLATLVASLVSRTWLEKPVGGYTYPLCVR